MLVLIIAYVVVVSSIMLLVPYIVKRVDNGRPLPKGTVSYRPLPYALFVFFIVFTGVLAFPALVYDWVQKDRPLSVVLGFGLFVVSGACSYWVGYLLNAKITISKDKLIITHAAQLKKGKVHVWNPAKCNLYLSWNDIAKVERDLNFLRIELRNGQEYLFPIGWCRDAAGNSLRRHIKVGAWKRPKSFII